MKFNGELHPSTVFNYSQKLLFPIGMISAFLIAGYVDIAAANSGVERRLSEREVKQIEDFKKPYKYLLDGNTKAMEVNLKKANFYEQKAKKLKARSKKDKAQKRKIADFKTLAKLHKKLYLLNSTILDSFNRGTTQTAKFCMQQLIQLETQIQSITRKEVERDWLTFSEFREYRNKGYSSRKTPVGVLPYSRKAWIIPKGSATTKTVPKKGKKLTKKSVKKKSIKKK